jgi:hypothetical protein
MFGMKKRAAAFLSLLALLTACGCGRKDLGQYIISLVMNGTTISSARDVVHKSGGLREQAYDVFFRAQPEELKAAIAKAGFTQEDWISETMHRYESFKKLVPVASQSAPVICYRREERGKYCLLMCSSDFTWAYAVHVDHGGS